MAAIGGSIQEVSIKGRIFAVASDADASKKLGGFEAEVQANGNGTARTVLTRVPWMVSGLQLEIDDTRGDQQYLQERANEADFYPISITLASGVTYSASGRVSGELTASTNNSTAAVTLSGPGQLGVQ